MDNDEVGAVVGWSFVVILIIVVAGFIFRSVEPTWRSMDREAIQQSQEYVTTKQQLLLRLAQDYTNLDVEISQLPAKDPLAVAKRSQKKAIVNRIRVEVALIPESEVPQSVKDILLKEGSR